MKTTRYMTLAALLLGLVAVAPVRADVTRADVTRAEIKDVLNEASGHVDVGRTLINLLSPTYKEHVENIKQPEDTALDAMRAVNTELNKTRPLDFEKMVSRAERSIRFYEIVIDLVDEIEDQADDADDDRNEDLAEDIRREYRRCKSKMRDVLKLIE